MGLFGQDDCVQAPSEVGAALRKEVHVARRRQPDTARLACALASALGTQQFARLACRHRALLP